MPRLWRTATHHETTTLEVTVPAADSDHLFLPKADQKKLREVLAAIPAVIEDLAITITRQDRTRRPGTVARMPARSGPPLDLEALTLADELHAELVGWVRLVCEHRGVAFVPLGMRPLGFVGPLRPGEEWATPGYAATDIQLAAWLARYMRALAMTPGAETALDSISDAVHACRHIVDLPPEDVVQVSREHVRAARRVVRTLDGLAKIAGQLGDAGAGLTKDRLKHLVRAGHLRACGQDVDTGKRFYRLGAALEAHAKCPTRKASS